MRIWLTALLFFWQINTAFAENSDGRWHAGIGDPTVFGWATVIFYALAVICAIRQARISKVFGASARLWYFLAAFLLFLGINKQLDLQSWFTEVMRDAAIAHGWYENRRPVQLAFVAILGFFLFIALLSLRLFLVNSWRSYKLTWIGILLLGAFILMRAAAFQHFDVLLEMDLLGIKISVLLEIGAIVLIILGTFFNKRFIYPLNAFTKNLRDYVEIAAEGNPVRCPQCGKQPLSKPIDGRVFKCRACGYRYSVRIINY